jgi:hypothetical protein
VGGDRQWMRQVSGKGNLLLRHNLAYPVVDGKIILKRTAKK